MFKGLRNGSQPVAVKQLHDGGEDVARALLREVRALRLVSSDINVVQLHGVVLDQEQPAMVLELCEASPLPSPCRHPAGHHTGEGPACPCVRSPLACCPYSPRWTTERTASSESRCQPHLSAGQAPVRLGGRCPGSRALCKWRPRVASEEGCPSCGDGPAVGHPPCCISST